MLDDADVLGARLDRRSPGWRSDDVEAVECHPGGGAPRRCEARDRAAAETIDADRRVLTHRVFGPVIFVLLMGAVFQSVFAWAQPAMDVIDVLVGALRRAGCWNAMLPGAAALAAGGRRHRRRRRDR